MISVNLILIPIALVVESSPVKRPRLSLTAPSVIHPGVLLGGVKESGRVVEAYTHEHMIEHGDEIITDLMFQIIRDTENDAFTPNPATHGYQLTPLGNLTFGPHVYRGARAIIFTVQERTDLLIKYQSDCEEIRSRLPNFHPLLKETFYGNRAAQESMAIKSLFVSPPTFLCAEKTGICNFSMNDESYRKCKLSKGTIRYSVMERSPGVTIYQFRATRRAQFVSFKDAMTLAIAMMGILETLHTKSGIIHGDIHANNVLLEPSAVEPHLHHLKLIDFEKASRNIAKPAGLKHPRWAYKDMMCSQWQIDGYYPAARDDIMKMIQMIAELMNPDQYYAYATHRAWEGYASLRSFKMKENIFAFPGHNPLDSLDISPLKKEAIHRELMKILDLVRGMNDVNSIPPYEALVDSFKNCIQLLP